jgi:hypothetical protein
MIDAIRSALPWVALFVALVGFILLAAFVAAAFCCVSVEPKDLEADARALRT